MLDLTGVSEIEINGSIYHIINEAEWRKALEMLNNLKENEIDIINVTRFVRYAYE